jgi:predicted glycosyltransferase
MLRISEALVDHNPGVSVLIITGSPMLHAFRLPPRIDYVKLPCLARNNKGEYGVSHLDMAFADAVRLRASLIMSAASDFQPDIVLIDKKPLGVAGEIGPALALLQNRPHPPTVHLLLRDILDTPSATCAVWDAHHYHDAIARHYASVLVVGDPRVFDLAKAYAFPPETRAKLHYCGYINRATTAVVATAEIGTRKRVLVHAGGGEDGAMVIEAALSAIALAGVARDFDCRIIGGPELGAIDRARLSARAKALTHVDWIDFSDAMGAEIAAADLIVSMGGYNSVCEILSYRKRAIIIPRSVPVREQRIRAEAMDALGLLRMIPLERLEPGLLLRMMRTELDFGNVVQSATARIRFNGLGEICTRLLGGGDLKYLAASGAREMSRLS